MLDLRPLRPIWLATMMAIAPACDGDGKAAGSKDDDGKAAEASSKAAEAGDGKAADGTAASGACDASRAKALEQEMLAGCELGSKVLRVEAPQVPWKAEASAPPRQAIPMQVTTEGTVVGWGPPVAAAELVARLTEERDRAKQLGEVTGEPNPGWSLTIASDVPRAEVAAVLGALAQLGETKVHLLLTTDVLGPIPKPRNPQVLARLHEKVSSLDPSQRATMLAKEIQQTMPPCPGVIKSFAAVATVAPDQKCPLLARGISEGLVECKCPDADELLTLIHGITLGTEPPTRMSVALPVTIDPSASPRAGQTWGEVVAGLDEAALAALWVSG